MHYCNPVNVTYRYQFQKDPQSGKMQICREAADPSMIFFKGRYYIFASMTLGVWVSDDLVHWQNHRLPSSLPLYDYAPDVRQIGEYVYFSTSQNTHNCHLYRTKDILNGPYEDVAELFPFWDPSLFCDEDGRIYLYWGCSNETPLWGVELDAAAMQPLGEKKPLIAADVVQNGFEVGGNDHTEPPRSPKEVEAMLAGFLKAQNITEDMVPPQYREALRGMFTRKPFIEGAWMTRHEGRYYLQYAFSGTEYNVYGDGVYVADQPLGPFRLAKNNPYSYHPGGFMPGAGHGSTLQDAQGRWWHASTMRISVNHRFERRVGVWPAGFDAEGELFCNQRYGDWPVDPAAQEPWAEPDWYLLSYRKPVAADGFAQGHEPELAADENVQTWWCAPDAAPGHWLQMDLGAVCVVNGIQLNFADAEMEIPLPEQAKDLPMDGRYIEAHSGKTRWLLQGSANNVDYFVLADKSAAISDLSHDFLQWEQGVQCRFLRLTIFEVPYGQRPCISGLRVFGKGPGVPPSVPEFEAVMTGAVQMQVRIKPQAEAVGYNLLWGNAPDKLYHSYMLLGATEKTIRALVAGSRYYLRVDAFNENGITQGRTQPVTPHHKGGSKSEL